MDKNFLDNFIIPESIREPLGIRNELNIFPSETNSLGF